MAGLFRTVGAVLGAVQRTAVAGQVASEGLVSQAARFTAITEEDCKQECIKKKCEKRFNELLNKARLDFE